MTNNNFCKILSCEKYDDEYEVVFDNETFNKSDIISPTKKKYNFLIVSKDGKTYRLKSIGEFFDKSILSNGSEWYQVSLSSQPMIFNSTKYGLLNNLADDNETSEIIT